MDSPDVNSDAGFEAFLAQQVGKEAPASPTVSETPDVQRGLESEPEAEGQARDDESGRFVPAAAPAEPEAPAAEAEAAPQETEEQAPAEEDDAQKMIGRQATEIGDLRKANQEMAERLARLEGRAEAQPQPQPQQPGFFGFSPQDTEVLENAFEQQGVDAVMQNLASQPGASFEMLEAALKVGWEYGPEAADWKFEILNARRAMEEAQAQPQEAQQGTPEWQQQAQRDYTTRLVLSEAQSAAGAQWAAIQPHWGQALDEAPDVLKEMVISEDAGVRAGGIQAVNALASAAAVRAATDGAQAQQEDKRASAAHATSLVTGSQRVATPSQPGSPAEESADRQKRFVEALLATPTTSVADGLREGRG